MRLCGGEKNSESILHQQIFKRVWAKVQAFHMRCQRTILPIKGNDFIPNVTVAATSGLNSIINIVRARRLQLFGLVARFSRDVPASNILSISCASEDGYPPDPSWRRSSGRPRTTWLDDISSDTSMSLTDAFSLAQDRSQLRASLRPQKLRVPNCQTKFSSCRLA